MAARFHKAFGILQPYVGFTFDVSTYLKHPELNSFNEFVQWTYTCFIDQVNPAKTPIQFVNKNPIHSLYINELISLDSHTKFIWMLRDYRANVHSRKKSIHLSSTNVYYNMLRWVHFEKKINAFVKEHPANVLLVRYEDLVLEQKQEIKRITDFLALTEIPNVADILGPYQQKFKTELDESYRNADRMQKRFGDLSKPINSQAVDQWKTGLSPNEIEICDVLVGESGKQHGYVPITKLNTGKKWLIYSKASYYGLRLRAELMKDWIFHSLPISWKVAYFERWVNRVNQKRQHHVER